MRNTQKAVGALFGIENMLKGLTKATGQEFLPEIQEILKITNVIRAKLNIESIVIVAPTTNVVPSTQDKITAFWERLDRQRHLGAAALEALNAEKHNGPTETADRNSDGVRDASGYADPNVGTSQE